MIHLRNFKLFLGHGRSPVDAHNLHQKVTKCSLFEHVLLDCKDKKLYKYFIEFINELLSQRSFEKVLGSVALSRGIEFYAC